jgi:magnesium-transporting ATPase (P-type)
MPVHPESAGAKVTEPDARSVQDLRHGQDTVAAVDKTGSLTDQRMTVLRSSHSDDLSVDKPLVIVVSRQLSAVFVDSIALADRTRTQTKQRRSPSSFVHPSAGSG